jgi:hypothetical protein
VPAREERGLSKQQHQVLYSRPTADDVIDEVMQFCAQPPDCLSCLIPLALGMQSAAYKHMDMFPLHPAKLSHQHLALPCSLMNCWFNCTLQLLGRYQCPKEAGGTTNTVIFFLNMLPLLVNLAQAPPFEGCVQNCSSFFMPL